MLIWREFPREMKLLKLIDKPVNLSDLVYQIGIQISQGTDDSKYEFNQEDKRRIAYHEVGHCFTAALLEGVSKPYRITIRAEGDLAGNTLFRIGVKYGTKNIYLREIAVLLAASVFEEHYLGNYSSLCIKDFDQIEKYLTQMLHLGMFNNSFGKKKLQILRERYCRNF